MNLYEASNQWATRPDDERFWTLDEMYAACRGYHQTARQASVKMEDLSVDADRTDVLLAGREGSQAKFTHWSFGQLCNRVNAPASYLRTLDSYTAAACLNFGLRSKSDGEAKLLMHANGSLVCRAFTSDEYSRIWNWEIVDRLRGAIGDGWRVPPARPARQGQAGSRPAKAEDVLPGGVASNSGLSVKVGDLIAPAGLYASDHDMFVFMVNEDVRIEDGSDGGLARGFFISNSEVGAAALKVTKFLYRHVCGNHIVWDVKDVSELKIVHRGRADRRYGYKLGAELRKYANESESGDRQRIESTKRLILGANKDEVLDRLFKANVLPRKTLDAAYEQAVIHEQDSPRSAWGMAQGITRLSQDTTYADARVAMDRAAGKVLSMAF